MGHVLFSIVIPSYNSADYIDATLASLSVQEYKSFEVIVIDDQSSDNTVTVAKNAISKYKLSGNVIVRPDNVAKGVASCRNLGIRNACAEWVCFLDSDDLYLPEALSATARAIEKYGDACFAYFHAARQFEDGTNKTLSIPKIGTYATPKDIFTDLTNGNFITTSTVTLKKSLAEEMGGFDITLHGIEDYMMWIRASKRTKWYYNSALLTDYRVRQSSLMGGREMAYYVAQNQNLIRSVRALREFSDADIHSIDCYLFDNAMQYYAQVALNTRGWGDFIKGLRVLAATGKIKLALRLFNKHFKFLMLKKLDLLKIKTV